MKTATPELIEFLNSNDTFLMADLFVFTLKNGTIVRYTNYDKDLTVDGYLYRSFTIKRDRTRISTGVEVDTLDVSIYTDNNDLTDEIICNSLNIIQAFKNGIFDDAELTLKKVFMPTDSDVSKGAVILFKGLVDVESVTINEIKLRINNLTILFNQKIPRNLFLNSCANTLYSTACGASKVIHSKSVLANSTQSLIYASLSESNGHWNGGVVKFTSGQNNLIYRGIRKYETGKIYLNIPLPHIPQVGDTFQLWMGCNKTFSNCLNIFGKTESYRGFPYIPRQETIL